jgi:hypothetical protein
VLRVSSDSAINREVCDDEAICCRRRSRASSFTQIAAKPYVDQAFLQGFVTELHLPMPTFCLSAEEQQDVIAYILSLWSGP